MCMWGGGGGGNGSKKKINICFVYRRRVHVGDHYVLLTFEFEI